jgi:hypothetical protein
MSVVKCVVKLSKECGKALPHTLLQTVYFFYREN